MSQIRQNFLVVFWPICDVAATLQIRQNHLSFFDQYATSQRFRRFGIIYLLFSANLRRRSDVADSSNFTAYFLTICDVAATSQIRQKYFVIFPPICVADSSRFIGNFSTNLRRRRFVKIHWFFSNNLRRRCDNADSSNFIGLFLVNLQRRRFVEIYCFFRPISDVSASMQIRQIY